MKCKERDTEKERKSKEIVKIFMMRERQKEKIVRKRDAINVYFLYVVRETSKKVAAVNYIQRENSSNLVKIRRKEK